jgi:hypothetical protein
MCSIKAAGLTRNVLATLLITILCVGGAAAATRNPGQASFSSPEEAAKALVDAAKADKIDAVIRILGPGNRDWILSGDEAQDAQARQRFVSAFEQKSTITKDGKKASIIIGDDDFPFPFPLIKKGGRWLFDTEAGKEELLNRQIGRNELNTIEALRAIVEAQREYAAMPRDGSAVPEYARKFRSSEGNKDGLYWPTAEGEKESPLGPLVAEAVREGYRAPAAESGPAPYQGYYFRILSSQGRNAPGGAYDYVVKGKMIGGFAVIAYPAKYGISGVKTFMVNHEGVVYEADLGPKSIQMAEKIRQFDPGANWQSN